MGANSPRSRFQFRRFFAIAVAAAVLFCLSAGAMAQEESRLPEVVLRPTDRILILAPHPDDEVLGCGGIIQHALAMGVPVRVIFLTYGDNNEPSFFLYEKHLVVMPKAVRKMGEMRREEALTAANILGLPPEDLTFLGYPDWGTLLIWYRNWDRQPPRRSMLTRVTAVPYADAFRPGALYKGEEILKDLETLFRDFKPTKIFVAHPADTHPDHQSCYLFTRVALWDLESEIHPELYPYLVHYRKWPIPIPAPESNILRPPEALSSIRWENCLLSPSEVEKKEAALKAHKSQYMSGPRSMGSFVRLNELFGDFPMIPLFSKLSADPLSQAADEPVSEPPEGLTEEERSPFIGLEWRQVALRGENLSVSMLFSSPKARRAPVSLYLFGYRKDTPFGRMPKLRIRIGTWRYEIFNQSQRLPRRSIRVERNASRVTVRISLELLGNPDRIFVSGQTYPVTLSKRIAWRVLERVQSSMEESKKQ